jgi:acylphosphatase
VHEEQAAKRYYVSGRVQGVGYRFFVERVAQRLGIAGYAKNLRDGRVEVYAVATTAVFADLRAELQKGPRAAVVNDVIEEDAAIEPRYSDGFSIEFDA